MFPSKCQGECSNKWEHFCFHQLVFDNAKKWHSDAGSSRGGDKTMGNIHMGKTERFGKVVFSSPILRKRQKPRQASSIMQKLQNRFTRKVVGGRDMGQERTHYILAWRFLFFTGTLFNFFVLFSFFRSKRLLESEWIKCTVSQDSKICFQYIPELLWTILIIMCAGLLLSNMILNHLLRILTTTFYYYKSISNHQSFCMRNMRPTPILY